MTDEELFRRHPRLWHMAADGAWEGIRLHGLLSVTALLDLYGIAGEERVRLESMRRPASVPLRRDGLPGAVVRDNKPMFESVLARNLQDGLVPRQWYETLNAKAFLWLDEARLERLLAARAYSGQPQTVIQFDTRRLVGRHRADVRLSAINSGQTLYGGQPRGLSTFMRIEDFPTGQGRTGGGRRPAVVELVVEGGIPDVGGLVVSVDRRAGGSTERLWP